MEQDWEQEQLQLASEGHFWRTQFDLEYLGKADQLNISKVYGNCYWISFVQISFLTPVLSCVGLVKKNSFNLLTVWH